MRRLGPPLGARLGLLVAIVALLPGLLALLAAGVGGDPLSSSLCLTQVSLTQAAGACSVAALQGLDRRVVDAAPALPPPACVEIGKPAASIDIDALAVASALESPTADRLPLRI